MVNNNAAAFAEKILTELQKRNIDFTLCRGQAYSGIKSALQTQMKKLSPNCCAHVLNLVTIEAMSVNTDVQLVFGTALMLNAFLTSSLPRLHTLKEHQKSQYESTVDTLKRLSDTRCASSRHAVLGSFFAILATLDWKESKEVTLKRLADTRCASRKHAVHSVVESFFAILGTLDSGESTEYKGSVRAEAMGLSVLIKKYSFVFLMLFVQKLSSCNQTTCNAFAKSESKEKWIAIK